MNLRKVALGRGKSGAGWSLASKDASTGGGAERAGGVSTGEGHAAFRETFNVGSFVELGMTVESGVSPAEVIGKYEENVGLRGLFS